MSTIAVIPARGGSKGVPMKNIKDLNGLPLIAYTIKAAIRSEIFQKIIVSTDSSEIADVALKYGAEVPFLRPENISGDSISSDDVVLHALDFFREQGKQYEYVCKLQPTSPLRRSEHIRKAYSLLTENGYNYVVSVCECEHSPRWSGKICADGCMDHFMADEYKRAVRQNIDKFYRLNGAIYFGKVKNYYIDKNFLGKGCYAYRMKQEDSIDIDSPLDFKLAEFIMKEKEYATF